MLTLAVALMGGAAFAPAASAQCVTIGARICQGGYIYVCEPCGSEKCWIATSDRCLRDDPREEEQRSSASVMAPRPTGDGRFHQRILWIAPPRFAAKD